MFFPRPARGAVLPFLLLLAAPAGAPLCQTAGFQIDTLLFAPTDSWTEDTFSLDSGPMLQLGFRIEGGPHSVTFALGYHQWKSSGGIASTDLDIFPFVLHYRHSPWHGDSISPFFGGGLRAIWYSAEINGDSSATWRALLLEPVLGVEFFGDKKVRLDLSVLYSLQVANSRDSGDFCFFDCGPGLSEPRDIDFSGFYTTLSVVFTW